MNQTTWIVGGGVVIVLLAALLYAMSGDGRKTEIPVPTVPEEATPAVPTPTPASESDKTGADASLQSTSSPTTKPMTTTPTSAVLSTTMGDIAVEFYPKDAPNTVANFLKLAQSGFYNGVKFHRVIKGFMNQTGDPLSKDDTQMARWGTGGPGYAFADEIAPSSELYLKGYKHGVLAMANSGPNTNGSQFFIMAADYPLPPLYTIFGRVTSGLDVVDKINAVETDRSVDRPLVPVIINSVELK